MASQEDLSAVPQIQAVPVESADLTAPSLRADDFEEIKKQYLTPDPYLEIEDEQTFTWEIEGWRYRDQPSPSVGTQPRTSQRHSDLFQAGGHPWRILLFPHGNNSDSASIYLEHAVEDAPPDWYCCVQFMLVMWNPKDPTIYTVHFAKHRFTPEVTDWGFTKFADLRKLFASQWENKSRPMIEDDRVNVTAYLRIYNDPTGVLWHDFINYDSKKATGLVGLRNQGATCYLNSLLQSLYFTPCLRKAVFQIPTNNESEEGFRKDSVYALQKLFYQLQTSNDAVPTNELTVAFGWDAKQIFEQQDVQELSRILMERLEERMKGTEAENSLTEMFVGKMKTFISCINVNYESSRVEDFWDIQLNVSGNKTLDDSFRDYIQVETMEGENQYSAENYGLQDARKGVIFNSFPRILHLQLKRFEYDYNTDMMMKLNDRYEFPEVWDATPYLSSDADFSRPWTYKLYGVLVHSGDVNAGHYYAFIRPEKDGIFHRFDDDRVTKATLREALDENFGGDHGTTGNGAAMQRNPYTRAWSTKKSMNAYMLVYFRECDIDKILLPRDQVPAPDHLEKHRILVAGTPQFSAHSGLDIAPWVPKEGARNHPKLYNIHHDKTFTQVYEELAKDYGYDPAKTRAWVFMARRNETIRPDHPIKDPNTLTLDALWKKYVHNPSSYLRLWIEEAPAVDETGAPIWPDMILPESGEGHHILLFLKIFDPVSQSLRGVKHFYAANSDPVEKIAAQVREELGWPAGTPILLYEEIKKDMIDEIYPGMATRTLSMLEIQDGDILTVQKALSEEETTELAAKDYCLIPTSFYNCLHQIALDIKPMTGCTGEETKMMMNGLLTYEQWATKIAEKLGKNPEYLMFFALDGVGGRNRGHIRPLSNLQAVISPFISYRGQPTPMATIYYEEIDVPFSQLDQYKYLRVQRLYEGTQKADFQYLWVSKAGMIADVQELVCRKAGLDTQLAPFMRLYEVRSNLVMRELSSEMPVSSINDTCTMYAELIPEEDRDPNMEKIFVNTFHFDKDPMRTHSAPFIFAAHKGERFADTKKRMLARTGMKDKDFEKIAFGLVSRADGGRVEYLEDDDQLFEKLSQQEEAYLGLDHPPKLKQAIRPETITIR